MSKLLKPKPLAIIVGILALLVISILFVRVPLPTILLPAEAIPGLAIGSFKITNTFIATILADIIVLALGFLAVRKMQDVPESKLQNIFEWVVEIFDGMLTDIGGKEKARSWLAVFLTILLFLLFANWLELVPGIDSIGYIEPLELAYAEKGVTVGYKTQQIGPFITVTTKEVILSDAEKEQIEEEFHKAEEEGHAYHPEHPKGYVLTPYVRAAATDLNLTIGLALLVVIWSHVIGFRRLGAKYARRFALPVITGMKPIDFFVGVLEFISEFAKIISLSFRLFGNIFAGQVLLFVMAFLVAFLLPLPFMGLELFVGFMQAFVFAILTFIYFEQATHSHAGDEHH
ncbi:MAG TPA: F0F1 ATP synthase subunit A [Anaerolineae bacterium]|nr:F0F1 ATP synthase subunit A [Anaerolineae bacterium]